MARMTSPIRAIEPTASRIQLQRVQARLHHGKANDTPRPRLRTVGRVMPIALRFTECRLMIGVTDVLQAWL